MVVQIPEKYIHDRSHEFKYSIRWDSMYCFTCMEWIEDKCDCSLEDNCPFNGWHRPNKPIYEIKNEKAEY